MTSLAGGSGHSSIVDVTSDRVITRSAGALWTWDIRPDPRPPAALTPEIARSSPWRLDRGQLIPATK